MNRFLFVIFSVIHCITCLENQCLSSTSGDQAVLVQLGQNITLQCGISENCDGYNWRISRGEDHEDIREGECGQTYSACFERNQGNDLQVYPNRYDLYYQCSCLRLNRRSTSAACLKLIPQFNLNVSIDGESQTFNSSCDRNTENEILNVTEGQRIRAICPEMSDLENSCFTSAPVLTFLVVSKSSHGCYIACNYNDCSVNVSLNFELGEATTVSTTYDTPERKTNPESPGSDLTFGVFVLVIVVIILLLVAFVLCTYLYFAKGKRKPISSVTNKSKIIPKSKVENIPTYAVVNKDTNGHENDNLLAIKEKPSNNSTVIDAEYSFVNLESTVKHAGNPKSSPGNVTAKTLEEVKDVQYSVVNDESKKNAKIESVRSPADYDEVDKSSSQSISQTPDLDIPEYAEVKDAPCKQETDDSVLYAAVGKKS